MALKIKLSRTAIDATGTEMYISDVTGDYSSENEGGWGSPNITREESNLFFQAFYITSKGKEPVIIEPYDIGADEKTITLFTDKDGYIEVLAAAVSKAVPNSEGGVGTSLNGDIVIFKDGELVPTTIEELITNEPLFLEVVSFKTVLLSRITIHRNRLNIDVIQLKQSKNNDRSHNMQLVNLEKRFNFVRGLLDGAIYLWCSNKFIKSQLLVESFNEILKEDE